MDLRIDFASLTSAAGNLQGILDATERSSTLAQGTTLGAGYSGMPELSALGAAHGAVLTGGAGSALTILKNFAQQIDWGRYNLERNHDLFENHELGFAQAFAHGDLGGAVHAIKDLATARPDGGFGNFSFPTPAITPNASLADVIAKLTSTDTGQAAQAGESWNTMSAEAATIATQLTNTAAQLQATNDGTAVDAACRVITDMAQVATQFSANAAHMAATVTYLATIPAAFTPSLVAMKTATDIIQDPVEKTAAEKLALTHFYSVYGPAIQAAIPATRNLTQPLPGGGGGGGVAGMTEQVGQDFPTVQQLRHSMASGIEQVHQQYHPNPAGQRTPHAYASPPTTPHQGQLGQPGQMGPANMPASSGGGGISPHYHPAPGHYGGPGTTNAHQIATERAAYAPPAEITGAGAAHSTNPLGGGQAPAAPGLGGVSGRPMPTGHGGVGGIGGLGGFPGTPRLAAPRGAGIGASGSSGGDSRGVSSNFRESCGRMGGTGTGGTGAATTGRGGVAGGGAMMGGVPPGGRGSRGGGKRHKATCGTTVKGVLRRVEQTQNQQELLGPRPATVPGVIGHWVRKAPQERTAADYGC